MIAFACQAEWREEVKKHFEKIKSEGTCIHRLDEELIRRRRDELRSATLLSFLFFFDDDISIWHLSRTLTQPYLLYMTS